MIQRLQRLGTSATLVDSSGFTSELLNRRVAEDAEVARRRSQSHQCPLYFGPKSVYDPRTYISRGESNYAKTFRNPIAPGGNYYDL